MFIRETPILFGDEKSLAGVITEPDPDVNADPSCILLLNSGRTHRVGPNRIYVDLARKLSDVGFFVLRFDFPGIGDSGDEDYTISFTDQAVEATKEAMRFLERERGLKRFILFGICSGAMIAFEACFSEHKVEKLVMINFDPARTYGASNSDAVDRNVVRSYGRALLDIQRWMRVFTFQTRYRNILNVGRYLLKKTLPGRIRADGAFSEKLEELIRRDIAVLAVLGEQEIGLDYLQLKLGDNLDHLRSTGRFDLKVLPDVSHTFNVVYMQEMLVTLVYDWIIESTGPSLDENRPPAAAT